MPWLEIYCETAFPLASSLVDIPGSVIEDSEHRDDAIGMAVGALDISAIGPDIVNAETDASRGLADQGAPLQSVVDAFDAVILHLEEEAAGHLGIVGAGVEEGGGGVGEPLLAHELVGVQGRVDVLFVDAQTHPHQQVLRPFHDHVVHLQ